MSDRKTIKLAQTSNGRWCVRVGDLYADELMDDEALGAVAQALIGDPSRPIRYLASKEAQEARIKSFKNPEIRSEVKAKDEEARKLLF